MSGFWDRFKQKVKTKKTKREKYWWENQGIIEYDEPVINDDYYSSGYYNDNYSYHYEPVKPTYDLSVSLETRIASLVQTITGISKKIISASGWGVDDKFVYFNPKDITFNASDDEVLGRILHQSAISKYRESKKLKANTTVDNPYRHLLLTLDQWRNDRQLWDYYQGCKYYAKAYWEESGIDDYKPKEIMNSKGGYNIASAQEFNFAEIGRAHV